MIPHACLILLVAFLGAEIGLSAAAGASPSGAALAVRATPDASVSPACIPEPTDDPRLADSCSLGWWTTWASCPITPVRNLGWEASGADALLARLPWLEAAPGRQFVGHLFYGNRPLPLGGTFPDGMNAKLLWEFARPIVRVTIVATRLDPPARTTTIVDAQSDHPFGRTQVPSLMAHPAGGCWRVDIRAEDRDGNVQTGEATFVVIDG